MASTVDTRKEKTAFFCLLRRCRSVDRLFPFLSFFFFTMSAVSTDPTDCAAGVIGKSPFDAPRPAGRGGEMGRRRTIGRRPPTSTPSSARLLVPSARRSTSAIILISGFSLTSPLLPPTPSLLPLILLLLRLSLTIRTRTNAAAAAASSSTTTSTALLVVLVFGTAFAFHPILSSVSSLSIDFCTLGKSAFLLFILSFLFFLFSLLLLLLASRFKYSQTSANVCSQFGFLFFFFHPFSSSCYKSHTQETHAYKTKESSCTHASPRWHGDPSAH